MPEGNPLVAQAQSQTTGVTGIGIAEPAVDAPGQRIRLRRRLFHRELRGFRVLGGRPLRARRRDRRARGRRRTGDPPGRVVPMLLRLPVWEDVGDDAKRRQFWRWYLLEALPAA